ncbi:MAG TPA: DUF4998 domain-containing protein [Anseongella sp.]|nr:DUF4998 domain-containing protein [Anseongella sp.]
MKMTKYTAAILLAAAGLVSCTKEDEYKEFAAGGEITYPGRVDSVIVQSGYNRLNLKIVMGSDPAVTRLKAYWNDRADSVEVELVRTEENDTLDIMIDDLAEGQYNFNIYTYDSENNVSVVKNASGNVYGDSYQRALANRGIKSLQRSRDGHRIIIDWNAPGAGEAAMELNYTDVNGVSRSLTAPGGQMVTELPSYEEESLLRYRSIFLPEPDARWPLFIAVRGADSSCRSFPCPECASRHAAETTGCQ